jgi:choline dehydrogenase-like flavoprotein
MSPRVVVVGSGASGVHFALTALRKGARVTMFDVGREAGASVSPDSSLNGLKDTLADPSAYFLGGRYEGALLPGAAGEYYGIPPNKDYVFEVPDGWDYSASGFAPLFSFAQGGLAQAWTGGCYPLNEDELADFPFSYRDLACHYDEVARRIGVTGAEDDLAKFMPVHEHLLPPLELDRHSATLMARYASVRSRLNRAGTHLGRTRVATLSQALGSRKACDSLGRCLWGCPRGSLYTPSQTLDECRRLPDFEYVSGVLVDRFTIGDGGRVRSLVARPVSGGTPLELEVDQLALAAGALSSTKIILMSVLEKTGERIRLRGLMDNRQILLPFVNLGMIGRPFVADSYQYHQLGVGIEASDPRDYVHGQITTLKTGLLHPIIQRLPFNLATSTFAMRALHAALGIVNVNFRDTRRDDNYVELAPYDGRPPRLSLRYTPDIDEPHRINETMRRMKWTLRRLRCVVPPGMAHVRPMGASVHYAGTMPMTRTPAPFTTTALGQSRDFENLFILDGAAFPFLPAKNLTFTLMANAVRIADAMF